MLLVVTVFLCMWQFSVLETQVSHNEEWYSLLLDPIKQSDARQMQMQDTGVIVKNTSYIPENACCAKIYEIRIYAD